MARAMTTGELLVSDANGRVQLASDYRTNDVMQSDQPGEAEAKKDGGLSLEQLSGFLADMGQEPAWRTLADKCADYYDNKQLDSDLLQLMEDRGVPPLISNMIKPTVDAVLGMEAKNRRDWMVTYGDEGESEQVAKGINKKLNTAERDAGADRAISQAYAGQVKAGLHWVEVKRESNPMRESKYRINAVHRREIWWDWRNYEEPDWRYLVRKKWFDEDHLVQGMPQYEWLIRNACRGWPQYGGFGRMVNEPLNNERAKYSDQAAISERAFSVSEHEWRDMLRRRIVVYEAWYRVWKRGLVCRLPNNQVIEFNVKNPRHLAGYQAGIMSPFAATYPQVRQSMWLGPHRVFDRKTPHPHNHFPYVPFFGFREDTTQIPYGLIRTMISPQDEINARRSRIQALSGSRRLEMDNDAVDPLYNTVDDVVEDVSRADSAVILNPNRTNKQHGIKITDNGDLTTAQFQMMKESKDEIHQASGLFPSMLGDQSGATSGIAINSLVEQSTTTLGEINDEYAHGRRRVGELFLSLIVADSQHEHSVSMGEGKSKSKIYFNRPMGTNDVGDEVLENDVSLASLKLELEDVPSTQTYRQQQFAQLAEITKALPPDVQKFVIDFVIEATDNPDRHKMAKRIRSALGIPEEGMDGQTQEDPAVTQVKQQADAMVQQLTQELQQAMAELAKEKAGNDTKITVTQMEQMLKKYAIDTVAATADKDRELTASLAEQESQTEADRLVVEQDRTFLDSVHRAAELESRNAIAKAAAAKPAPKPAAKATAK